MLTGVQQTTLENTGPKHINTWTHKQNEILTKCFILRGMLDLHFAMHSNANDIKRPLWIKQYGHCLGFVAIQSLFNESCLSGYFLLHHSC